MKNQTPKLIIGLAITCTSIMVNTGLANQVVLAKSQSPEKCNIFAYVIDKSSKGVNVRSGGSNKNSIIGAIPANETLNVIAVSRQWAKITNASAGFKNTGWVFLPMLGISSRGYGTNGVNIYTNTNQQSRKIGRVPPSERVKLLGCQGGWAKVEYKGVQGWLAKEDQCGAALTSCS
ncbi:SH3 domain-containing protein [Calothrix sp. PCC 7507]|uniref:SH3 domain-containing protein n=1 Tax=Calothrix sp. PCC 7507 TaxID=99598 RepID=UPI00029EFCEB|nr:SH3 domain-containing protein [Calothrix sp. PCC 7507]AFY33843.1 SH3 type 3 domain protein [Calothrix sp. PCC 7507]